MIKIWGTAFSLIGDLIMRFPQLTYFKMKYDNTYNIRYIYIYNVL